MAAHGRELSNTNESCRKNLLDIYTDEEQHHFCILTLNVVSWKGINHHKHVVFTADSYKAYDVREYYGTTHCKASTEKGDFKILRIYKWSNRTIETDK